MPTVWNEVRLAARSLRKTAGFTSLAALVLAVGIGATSITFSLIDATVLRPLPYRDPAQLVMLWEHSPSGARSRVSPLNFLDWSEQSHVFDSMAGVVPIGCNIHDGMIAYIDVVDTGLAARTDGLGRAVFADVPPGMVVGRVWHPYLRAPGNRLEYRWSAPRSGRQDQAVTIDLRAPPRPGRTY